MLIPYVAKYEKVVMGLLSYLAPYRALEDLTLEMKRIKSNQRQVYLWRDEETDNVIAIMYGISGTLEMSECLKKWALREQRTISEIIGLDVKKNEGQHG